MRYDHAMSPKNVVSGAAATLSITEVALGSFVHGLKIPFGGHTLSLNQGLFLTRTVRLLKQEAGVYRYPLYVSSIAAALKSLSPAGQKLGPMLSISMQGLLYAIGITLGGANLFGVSLGMVLLSLWAFVQPLLTLYLFFGSSLVEAAGFYAKKLNEELGLRPEVLLWVLGAVALFKALLAVGVGAYSWRGSLERLAGIEARLWNLGARHYPAPAAASSTVGERLKLVAHDLTKPFFLFSLLLVGVFLVFTQGPGAHTVWLLLRPVALAAIFFYLARSPLWIELVPAISRTAVGARFLSYFASTLERIRRAEAAPPVTAIVLAAGRSSRMGENKLLLPWESGTVLGATLSAIRAAGPAEIFVVVGPGGEAHAAEARAVGARVVENSRARVGMHSSIRAGIEAASADAEGFLICLGDQPAVRSEDYRRLLEAFAKQPEAQLACPRFAGKRGNPVLVRANLKSEILAQADDDRGCNYLFQRYPDEVAYVEIEHDGIHRDVDTPEQYRSLRAK